MPPIMGAGTGAVAGSVGTPMAGTSAAGGGAAGMTTTGAAGRMSGAAGRMAGGAAGAGAAGSGTAGSTAAGSGAAGMAAAGSGAAGEAAAGSGGTAGTAPDMPVAGAGSDPGGDSANACLSDITNYFEEGPFDFMMMRMGSINFWRPMVPAGCKVPVIHLANGTTATCSAYRESLERFASHGFLSACYESPNTGAGTQGLEALKAALSMFPDLADKKFGSTGHSQGGQASFAVLQFAEEEWGEEGVYAGLAMQPASGFGERPAGGWQTVYGRIKSPMFMFSGRGTDGLVSQSWVQDGFDALSDSVEAYHWTKAGGTHIPVPNGEEMQIGIVWFRWKLLGDQKACEAFKAIPMMDNTWEEVAVQNAAPCM